MPATRAQIAPSHGAAPRKEMGMGLRSRVAYCASTRWLTHHRLTGIWVTRRTWGEQQPRCRAKLPDSRTSFRTTRTSGLWNATRQR